MHDLGLHVAMTCINSTWFNTHHRLEAAVHCSRIGGRQTQEEGEAREQLGFHISLCSISMTFWWEPSCIGKQHHGNPWVFLVGGLAKHIACSSNGNPTRQTLKQLRQASWECTQLCKCINTEATPQGRGPKPSPKNPPKPNILES